jgi:hypothetical protein
MTRLERIIKVLNDYDKMAEDLLFAHNDICKDCKLNELRNEVSLLIEELKRHGCRREY